MQGNYALINPAVPIIPLLESVCRAFYFIGLRLCAGLCACSSQNKTDFSHILFFLSEGNIEHPEQDDHQRSVFVRSGCSAE